MEVVEGASKSGGYQGGDAHHREVVRAMKTGKANDFKGIEEAEGKSSYGEGDIGL